MDCAANHPQLQAFWDQTDRSEVTMVSLAVWSTDNIAKLRNHQENKAIPWPIMMATTDVRDAYSATSTPTLVLVAPDGTLAERWTGGTPVAIMLQALQRVL